MVINKILETGDQEGLESVIMDRGVSSLGYEFRDKFEGYRTPTLCMLSKKRVHVVQRPSEEAKASKKAVLRVKFLSAEHLKGSYGGRVRLRSGPNLVV